MDIKLRSRRYSPEMRVEIETYSADDLDNIADGWRDNAIDTILGPEWIARCWALAAYFQYRADRKRNPDHYAR